MSALDWAGNTARAFATQRPSHAASEAVETFVSGVIARYLHARLRFSTAPIYTTELLGERLRFVATDMMDIKRARTLNDELPAASWLAEGIDEGAVFWDVGAYHGHYSTVMAAKRADVLAFEPSEKNLCRARLNAELNECSVYYYPLALSDTDGERVLGGTRGGVMAVGRREGDVTTTPARRGERINPAPDVVKIDVEGHECAVLDGLSDHLPGVRRVLVEVHDDSDVARVKAKLSDAGLTVREIDTARAEVYVGAFQ